MMVAEREPSKPGEEPGGRSSRRCPRGNMQSERPPVLIRNLLRRVYASCATSGVRLAVEQHGNISPNQSLLRLCLYAVAGDRARV